MFARINRLAGMGLGLCLAFGTTRAQDCLSWQLASTSGPGALGACAMAYDEARRVTILFNGQDTWEWNGAVWTLVATTGPSPRSGPEMAYDSARGVIVLFGGNVVGVRLGDTWEFDGITWSQRSSTGPSPRSSHAMAYDSARGVVVLFGGSVVGSYVHDTWEWDGVEWQFRSSSGPLPDGNHRMTYDSRRGVVVLHGSVGVPITWEWNGQTWTLKNNTAPTPRSSFGFAYDPIRRVCVMFGGGLGASGAPTNETWEWNGTQWRFRNPSGTILPEPRLGHSMVYDTQTGQMLVYGGTSTTFEYTWLLDFTAVTQPPGNQTVRVGDPVQFTVGTQSSGTCTYRWTKDAVPLTNGPRISGATSPVLTISSARLSDSADYAAQVTGVCPVTSPSAALTVLGLTGDLNCDNSFNGADIDPFFLALGDAVAYMARFPNCDFMLADINGDGYVNGADIDPFFACLGAGGCP